jgi:c-di-GMP-binding flagellar brake protein YcgR
MEERRKSKRLKKPVTAQYCSDPDAEEKKWDMTFVRDISETGMCITLDMSLASGKILAFRLKLPSAAYKWIEVKGSVIESKMDGYTTRVEFVDLKEEDKKLISEFIAFYNKEV